MQSPSSLLMAVSVDGEVFHVGGVQCLHYTRLPGPTQTLHRKCRQEARVLVGQIQGTRVQRVKLSPRVNK